MFSLILIVIGAILPFLSFLISILLSRNTYLYLDTFILARHFVACLRASLTQHPPNLYFGGPKYYYYYNQNVDLEEFTIHNNSNPILFHVMFMHLLHVLRLNFSGRYNSVRCDKHIWNVKELAQNLKNKSLITIAYPNVLNYNLLYGHHKYACHQNSPNSVYIAPLALS